VAERGEQPVPGDAKLPPIQQIAVAIVALIVIGGIYTASYLPRHAPRAPVVALLAAAAALLVVEALLLARIRPFNWRIFRVVGGWYLLVYVLIVGMLEYVFVYDHVSGSQLVLLSAMLVVFALNLPLLLAFSVARFQAPDS
jgi:hypothetical protein